MCSPVAWSAERRDAAELATPGWRAWWWPSLRAWPLCPSCGARKWQKPGCALPRVLAALVYMRARTHTHSSSFVAGIVTPFVFDKGQLPPAWPPFACEITGSPASDSQGTATACAHCLGHQGENSRAECGSAAVMVPGGVQGCGVSLASLCRQGHHPLLLPRRLCQRTQCKRTVLEQSRGEPAPALLGQPPQIHC